MQTITVGRSDLEVSRLAYGAMRIVGTWNPAEINTDRAEQARKALLAAYEAGYTLFDHADIYCRGECETHHGLLLKDSPELRRQTLIATKCGIRFQGTPLPEDPGRYDFSKGWIVHSCEASLKRLNVEAIDLYQLHRPDVLMNPEEVAEAFTILQESGKVRWFGVSNFLPSQVTLLQKYLRFPLIVNQVEVSLQRLDCFNDGTLDQCLGERITPLSWGPLGGGTLGTSGLVTHTPVHTPSGDLPSVAEVLTSIGFDYGVSPSVIALAWLLKHPSGIIPIVGSTNPKHIADATRAATVDLSREEWYRLYVSARGARMP